MVKPNHTIYLSRSSIYKTPLIQANCTGIIDKDYRGNICVALRYIINDDLINIIRNQAADPISAKLHYY